MSPVLLPCMEIDVPVSIPTSPIRGQPGDQQRRQSSETHHGPSLLLAFPHLSLPLRWCADLELWIAMLDMRWSRSVFEGESLMLACNDKPIRRQAERFPLGLVACLEVEGTGYRGLTNEGSEQGRAGCGCPDTTWGCPSGC